MLKIQSGAKLSAGILSELRPKLTLTFGVLPTRSIKPIVVTAALCGQPYFMQRFLQVHHQLTAVGKCQCDHASHPLVVYVNVGLLIELVAVCFQLLQQSLGVVHEFVISHRLWFLGGWPHNAEAAITISS